MISMFRPIASLTLLLLACGGSSGPSKAGTPAARSAPILEFDEARQQLILYGGRNGSTYFDDTWSWDGQTWTRLATSGPGGRAFATAAYDTDRQRIVLYGGLGAQGTLDDTWEWDGTAWSRVATTGPGVRQHETGGYDQARHRFVVQGGADAAGQWLTDTWTWDGSTWTQAASTAPAAQVLKSPAVYDGSRQTLLTLVGGLSRGATSLWEWNGSAWSVVGAGPVATMDAPMTTAPNGGGLLLVERGATWATTSPVWHWDGQQWSSIAGTTPPSAFFDRMAYDPVRDVVVRFGGIDNTGNSLKDVWEWDGAAWVER
jgi:Galactose oxidase, central domain